MHPITSANNYYPVKYCDNTNIYILIDAFIIDFIIDNFIYKINAILSASTKSGQIDSYSSYFFFNF